MQRVFYKTSICFMIAPNMRCFFQKNHIEKFVLSIRGEKFMLDFLMRAKYNVFIEND